MWGDKLGGSKKSIFETNMSIIIILILVSLGLGCSFLAAFIWAVKSGQFEDTTTPSLRILPEDRAAKVESSQNGVNPEIDY